MSTSGTLTGAGRRWHRLRATVDAALAPLRPTAAGSPDLRLISYDLFDTVVVRRHGDEAAVHHAVARSAGFTADPSPQDYVHARQEADRWTCRFRDAPSLDEIHDRLADVLGLDQCTSAVLRRLEIQIETDNLVAVPGVVDRLRGLRSDGIRIAFTSDSHLGERHLAPRLRAIGVLETGDLLVVSSDHGRSKARDGRLFDTLAAEAGCPPAAIRHHGDGSWNDVSMARRRGLDGVLESAAQPNRYESMLLAADDPSGLSALLAGASRIVRMRSALRGENPAVTEAICGVAAPTMIGFSLWIAAQTDERDLDQLHFLSRNGRLPFEVFRRIGPAIGCRTAGNYLRISRDSVRTASAAAVGVDHWLDVGHTNDWSFITEFGDRLDVARLLEKIGLDAAELADVLTRHDLRADLPLAVQSVDAWRAALAEPQVRRRIHAAGAEDLDRLVDYLAQAGIAAERRIGMVDIGWTGQQASMITSAIDAGFGPTAQVHHLHLGHDRDVALVTPTRLDHYLFGAGAAPIDNPIGLYELFSSTSEPGLDGLSRTAGGRVEPVFRCHPDEITPHPSAEPLVRLTCEMLDELEPHLQPRHADADIRPVLHRLAGRFWFEPSHGEGLAWGSMPWEVDSSGHLIQTFADPIPPGELIRVLRPGGLNGRQWSCGAAAASATPIRQLLGPVVRRRSRGRVQRRRADDPVSSATPGDRTG